MKTVKVACETKSGRKIHCPATEDDEGKLTPILPPGEELKEDSAVEEVK